MKKTYLLLIIGMMTVGEVSATEEKKIYKYTDENGVTHYTDKKPDDKYEEAGDLPELMVVPPAQNIQPSNRPSRAERKAREAAKKAGDYTGFRIVSPQPEENLWGTGGSVTASVDFTGTLLPTHRIQITLDGKKQPPKEGKTQVIDGIIRGEHTLGAAIVTADGRETIRQSQTITFFMHQNSVK
ncbi:DUF4124 domain-containing protein [Marinicella sp. W31]|uniref:DUF4124 domain-containing protein n=1 Tax=Marinicella sp. W31 TaxID=3023713 RepID=UPI0037577BE3